MIPLPVLVAFILLICTMEFLLGFLVVKTWSYKNPVTSGSIGAIMVLLAAIALVEVCK